MLYRLEVENFHSIKNPQVLDLRVGAKVDDPENRLCPIYPGSEVRIPKVVAFFGANASGKTTVLRALELIVYMIRDSASRPDGLFCQPFNNTDSYGASTKLAIELGGALDLSPDVLTKIANGEKVEWGTYRYELTIEAKEARVFLVKHEALKQRAGSTGKWQRVFERDALGSVKGSKAFPVNGYQHLLNTLSPNVSVISSFGMFQHPIARLFVEEARSAMFSLGTSAAVIQDNTVLNYLNSQQEMVAKLTRQLSRIDVGIEAMRFIDTPQGPMPMFRHTGLSGEMPWVLQSHGTLNFIKLFPFIQYSLDKGGIAVLDEMDSSLHPMILPEIIRWYRDVSKNEHNAQLWFTCHSGTLMDELTKEEIVVCEKDFNGRTKFFSLMQLKARRDENHYRKYFSGAYGGIPNIG